MSEVAQSPGISQYTTPDTAELKSVNPLVVCESPDTTCQPEPFQYSHETPPVSVPAVPTTTSAASNCVEEPIISISLQHCVDGVDGVTDGVTVAVSVGVTVLVGVFVGVILGVAVLVGVRVGVILGVTVFVGVLVGVILGVTVAVTVLVGVILGVILGVTVGVGVFDGATDDCDGVTVGVVDGVRVGVTVGVTLLVGVGVGVPVDSGTSSSGASIQPPTDERPCPLAVASERAVSEERSRVRL
jgi:hypothetical protein